MAEDLRRMVGSSEGEGPSPEFVATLRARIIAETETLDRDPGVGRAVGTVVELGAERTVDAPRRPSVQRRLVIGVVAAGIALVAGMVVATSTARDQATVTERPAFVADAPLLTGELVPVDPGSYLVDTVGTPFSVTFEEPVFVPRNDRGWMTIAHADSQDVDDRSIYFVRLSALSDPSQIFAEPASVGVGRAPDDVEGWIDELPDEVLISEPEQTTVGGRNARRVDLELGATDCQVGESFCASLGNGGSVHQIVLLQGSIYRIWIVEQADEDPLAIIAAVDRASDLPWFQTVDAILSTIAFGNIAPNPLLEVPAAPMELPFLGGVRVELAQPAAAWRHPAGFGRVELTDWQEGTDFLAGPLDIDGRPLETIDQLITAMQAADVEVTQGAPVAIGGFDAQTFDVATEPERSVLRLSPDERTDVASPTEGPNVGDRPPRAWALDHRRRSLRERRFRVAARARPGRGDRRVARIRLRSSLGCEGFFHRESLGKQWTKERPRLARRSGEEWVTMIELRRVPLALLLALVAACGSSDNDTAADDKPDTSTTSVLTSAAAEADVPDESAELAFDENAVLLTDLFGPLEPGSYRVNTVGTPFSFTTEVPLFVQLNHPGEFVLTDPASNGPDDRDIVVQRSIDAF